MTTTYAPLPTWAAPAKADSFALWEAFELLGYTGRWVRMTAADQRALLGFAVFGKAEFKVDADGTVSIFRSACFGTDGDTYTYTPASIREAATQARRLNP